MLGLATRLASRVAPRLFGGAAAAEGSAASTAVTSAATRTAATEAAVLGRAAATAESTVAGTAARTAVATGTGAAARTAVTTGGRGLLAGAATRGAGFVAGAAKGLWTVFGLIPLIGLGLLAGGFLLSKVFGGSDQSDSVPRADTPGASGPVEAPVHADTSVQRAPHGYASWADYAQNRVPTAGIGQDR